MPKNNYYYYDHEACTFVEVQSKPHKVLLHSAFVLALALVLAGAGMWAVYETSSTPKEVALAQENRALQQQLATNGQRFTELSGRLDELAETDRDLYRTIFQADPISEEVRQVGVGGASSTEFDGFSESTSRLLRDNDASLEKLERQVSLQRSSYDELIELAEERAEAIPQMPAILPTSGRRSRADSGCGSTPSTGSSKCTRASTSRSPQARRSTPRATASSPSPGSSSGYGYNVRIRHAKAKRITLYAHLSEIPEGIRPGARVERGDVIGKSGSTGLSTAPHLHYEIRRLNDEAINPIYSFAPGVRPSEYHELVRIAESENAPLD